VATTYDLIQTFNAASGGSAFADFTSIPSTYTDLIFIVSSRNTDIYNEIHWLINSETSSYGYMYWQGRGTTTVNSFSYASGSTIQGMVQSNSNSSASQFGAGILYVPYYQNTNMKKIVSGLSMQAKSSDMLVGWNSGSNNSTTTISSMRAQSSIGNLAEGTKISLYGIKNA
jgi:hypothetical protein